jgi:hypothetical protein
MDTTTMCLAYGILAIIGIWAIRVLGVVAAGFMVIWGILWSFIVR